MAGRLDDVVSMESESPAMLRIATPIIAVSAILGMAPVQSSAPGAGAHDDKAASKGRGGQSQQERRIFYP